MPSDAGSVSQVGHRTLRGDTVCHSLGEARRGLDVRGAQEAAEPTHSRSQWGGVSAALPGVLAPRGSREAVLGMGRSEDRASSAAWLVCCPSFPAPMARTSPIPALCQHSQEGPAAPHNRDA